MQKSVSPAGYMRKNTIELRFLRPTRQKTDHFGDVLPSQSLGIVQKNLAAKK